MSIAGMGLRHTAAVAVERRHVNKGEGIGKDLGAIIISLSWHPGADAHRRSRRPAGSIIGGRGLFKQMGTQDIPPFPIVT